MQAKKKLVQLMKSIIGERRRMRKNEKNMVPSPVKDMIDAFINDGSDELTDDHVVSNLINLMIPGNDSVPALIALVVKNLSESPLALRQIEVCIYIFFHFKPSVYSSIYSLNVLLLNLRRRTCS